MNLQIVASRTGRSWQFDFTKPKTVLMTAGLALLVMAMVFTSGMQLGRFALILPGWFVIDQTNLRISHSIIEQIAISIGLSLATIPLLMLWTTVLRISLSSVHKWIFVTILFLITFIKYFRIMMIYNSRKWQPT